MMKKMIGLSGVLALGLVFVSSAAASGTFAGRVTRYSGTSLSVFNGEEVTFLTNEQTTFSKLITQKPWGGDVRLDARVLRVGAYVAVHRRGDNGAMADWVQIATDLPLQDRFGGTIPLSDHPISMYRDPHPSETKRPMPYGADVVLSTTPNSNYRAPNPAATKRPTPAW
jgi:hypothetical protein